VNDQSAQTDFHEGNDKAWRSRCIAARPTANGTAELPMEGKMFRSLRERAASRRMLRLPAVGLTIAGLFNCHLAAQDLLDARNHPQHDVHYQIVSTSYRDDCNCRSRSYRPYGYYQCPPGQTAPVDESVDEDMEGVAPEGEPLTEPMVTSLPTIAGAQAAARGSGRLPGYIDDAFIRSRVRVRYDDMRGANEPTRAEFLYPTLGDFGGPGPLGGGGGAIGSAGEVDLQELATYVEVAFGPRFSVFGEFPIRWVEDVTFGSFAFPNGPFTDGVQEGAGDFRAGVRYGLIACPEEALTVQVRAWAPTGEARRALGVGHSSIDVALLYTTRPSERTWLFGEIQDWQNLDGQELDPATIDNPPQNTDSNVLRYGVGVGYDLWQSCGCRPQSLTALFEAVGWTVLEGVTTPLNLDDPNPVIEDAEGDTIINGKYGLRYSWTCWGCQTESVYVGYGHNWTDERWYSDVFRVELTHFF
jgi:hypothetical protein